MVDLKRLLKPALTLAGLITCLSAMVGVVRIGYARSIVAGSPSLASASRALEGNPKDPEILRRRARILERNGEPQLAIDDLRDAISLRPRDFRLWVELATAQEANNDVESSIQALSEAEKLAPSYYEIRWARGIALEKSGRTEEAFSEFRVARSIVPSIAPLVIEKAWQVFDGNDAAVRKAVNPQTLEDKLMLAHFFIAHDRSAEAVSFLQTIDPLSGNDRNKFVAEFINRQQLTEAYEIWLAGLAAPAMGSVDGIYDGGFEYSRISNTPGFAWVINTVPPATTISFDKNITNSGIASLRVDWKGGSDAAKEVVSQLTKVSPSSRYQLRFTSRAENLMSGGGPVITVTEISEPSAAKLGQSEVLPMGTIGWKQSIVEFVTGTSTRFIRITLQRQNCSEAPCPIFGSLWLDDFQLSVTPG